MITFRKIRRRRISVLKLLLVCFIAIGILFWFYQVQSIKNEEPVEHNSLSYVFPRSAENHVQLAKKGHKKQEKYISLFEKYSKNGGAFKNPALLHKLKAKPSKIPDKMSSKEAKLAAIDSDMPILNVTPGLGEGGAPVHLSKQEQKLADEIFNTAAFNVYLSDRISLNRSVPDPRNPK